MKQENGFTLVELAIVLMIIGLLIGGVLRGQEMINNARMQSIMKQVTSYQAAYVSFVDSYGTAPGDMPNAIFRIPNCNAASFCGNGDGNGFVGVPTHAWEQGDQAIASENTQFWKQMVLVHLTSGVDPSTNTVEWGKSHPNAAYGGFTVVTALAPPGWAVGTGVVQTGALVLRLQGSITGFAEASPVVSPKQAAYIDRKMDDGLPDTGDVQSNAFVANSGCEVAYDETKEQTACSLEFLIKR